MYNREYYLQHKEKYLESNKKWRKEHKDKFYEITYRYRRKKAEELKNKGEKYCWLSENQRKALYEKRNRRIDKDITEREI